MGARIVLQEAPHPAEVMQQASNLLANYHQVFAEEYERQERLYHMGNGRRPCWQQEKQFVFQKTLKAVPAAVRQVLGY